MNSPTAIPACAVIVGEGHGPAARHIGRRCRRRPSERSDKSWPSCACNGHVLLLAAELVEHDLALQARSPLRVGDRGDSHSPACGFPDARRDTVTSSSWRRSGPLIEIADRSRYPRRSSIQTEGQFAARQRQHGAIGAHLHGRRPDALRWQPRKASAARPAAERASARAMSGMYRRFMTLRSRIAQRYPRACRVNSFA